MTYRTSNTKNDFFIDWKWHYGKTERLANPTHFYFFVDYYICHIEPIDLFYEIFNDGMDKTQFKKMIDLRLIL